MCCNTIGIVLFRICWLCACHYREHSFPSSSQVVPGSELDLIITEIDELVEGCYSEAVFRHYKDKQPTLIRIMTGEKVSWDDAFGDSFDKLPKSLRHSLVGLVEGGGKYTLLGKANH